MNDSLLRSAMGLEREGKVVEAGRLYREFLQVNPRHFQALYQLANLDFAGGRYDAAEKHFAEAAKINSHSADVHFAHGCALQRLNRHAAAAAAFDKALALDGRHGDAQINRAVAFVELKRYSDAIASLESAIAILPRRADLWLVHGDVLGTMGRLTDSLASYGKALDLNPGFVGALNNRSAALFALGRYEEAAASYEALLALGTRDPTAYVGHGIALAQLKRHAAALASFDAALALDPRRADALRHQGAALLGLRRFSDALISLDRSLSLEPGNADALVVRGIVLKEQGRKEDALTSFARTLAVKPDCIEAFVNREAVLFELKRYEEAIRDCESALRLDPEIRYTRGDLCYYRLQVCDWRGLAEEERAIAARLAKGQRVIQPFMNVALSGSPESQLQCAQIWASSEYPHAEPLWHGERYRHDRIRLAYLSGDFCEHPVLQLMAGVFEHHDRRRFETIAISLGSDDGSALRCRAKAAFDRFIDAEGMGDIEIARLVKDIEVDIVVDLMGFTGKSRHGILAHRPAPVQVQYLGFPGAMGTGHVDYILADRTVIPEEQRIHYDEQVVYLPDSYMPHDSKRGAAGRMPRRTEAGLPESGFVFCSFNNSYKFSPRMFDIWMRLLQATEGSVLWLPQNNLAAERNLRREAQERGVAPERLVFAPFVPAAEEHLARLRLADLFLDTLPFNAHSTAMDALWAGLPVLTAMGETFAGRVAASLNYAAGLPDMVTHSLDGYEALALKLARDASALAAVKAKLARSRENSALFDTARFTRNLVSAVATMWRRSACGEVPMAFSVEGAGVTA